MPSSPRTRDQVLRVAARLFAENGYHGTTVEEIGAACGVSGPAVYKHYPNKQAILATLLIDISEQLLSGGTDVVASAPCAATALTQLVGFHTDFALQEPHLIRVQDRDLPSLEPDARRKVRRLQRAYVELWVGVLTALDGGLASELARIRAHATFGLLNSTPYAAGTASSTRHELMTMALRSLGASDPESVSTGEGAAR